MKEKRPWGWYDIIDHGDRYKVKSIEVQPGQKLSLQRHYHRSEHWVVVDGAALVEVGGKETLVFRNNTSSPSTSTRAVPSTTTQCSAL